MTFGVVVDLLTDKNKDVARLAWCFYVIGMLAPEALTFFSSGANFSSKHHPSIHPSVYLLAKCQRHENNNTTENAKC